MAQFSSSLPQQPPLLRLEPFKGINLTVTPTQIDIHQSPDMLNMTIDERGALNKRTGYTRVFQTSLGTGRINGMFQFRKKDGTTVFLIAHGTKLYTQSGSNQPIQIYGGLANANVNFFVAGDKCYLMDGTNYLVYDGTTVSQITPYIPTLIISKKPGLNSGGTLLEDLNLLGAGFKETFSGDNTGKDFYLSLKPLDATPLIVKVDNVTKTLTTDYTVDAANGKITFVTAPPAGTNNVEITAYKTQSGFANRIKKCQFSVLFGGSNDTRIFISGNPDNPSHVWRSGLFDPTYFPENGFYKVGNDNEKVQGFSKQYDYLVIEKEQSKWVMHFELQNGEPSFPLKPINDQVGTFAKGTIQTIENNPVSLDRTGVYMLNASTVRDERNVQHISSNVDARLLNEPNLENAISVDYDRKYWIVVNGNVYIYDYSIGEWYPFDNIDASCFLEINGELYFGSNTQGLVYRFMKKTEFFPYNDDGQPIRAHWISKVMSFDADEKLKLVEKVYFSLNPAIHTSADLYYVSDKKSRRFIKTTRKDLYHYGFQDYSRFGYGSREYPQEATNKIKAKKIVYFQIEVRNEINDEPLGLLSLGIQYQYQRNVK